MMRRMEYEELHQLVHRDAKQAWPHALAFIERDGGSAEDRGQLISDIVYSAALPELMDNVERAFANSERFQQAILWSSPEFGGRGGPEMDRLWKLVDEAERRNAHVYEVDSLERPPRFRIGAWWASMRGKSVIYRVRRRGPDSGPRDDRR